MSRLLGVDLGERRIGLAVGDPAVGLARPLATIRRSRDAAADAERLRHIVVEQGVSELVVGLPLDMSGDEGAQALRTRAWVDAVEPILGLPVSLRDERLSSETAERRLGPAPRGRAGGPPGPTRREARRARIDREAAAVILQDELDARAARAERTEDERT
ncbi:MAG TPA: Holliday junction resolvase RuvX [Candidatus Limnocylindrales bacterium]|nr:Holliday junction resolvase RuvX [Candidatus Limnocylindrales bacterium]